VSNDKLTYFRMPRNFGLSKQFSNLNKMIKAICIEFVHRFLVVR
jgi:hypothetical protein